jgi:hypothetical protein
MNTFLIRFYSEKLSEIKRDKSLDYKTRGFKIRTYQEKILKLKQGKLT